MINVQNSIAFRCISLENKAMGTTLRFLQQKGLSGRIIQSILLYPREDWMIYSPSVRIGHHLLQD